jgi:alanyl-tRNA synthetase
VFSEDEEAHALWRKIAGLPDERIVRIATSDNFWRMGDTGPCGPCSEIFYDHGEAIAGGPPGSPDADGDRFIEIWNLVFMQYEETADGVRLDLPRPSIDTGMGLERIAAVLQNKHNNYDIDLFQALIRASTEAIGVPPEGEALASHRVIADHLRASAFLVADGVLPSNEGRGYVVRRIMRRAMRHAAILGASDPVMWRLVPALVREMGAAYPELGRAETLITETLRLEETSFRRTLERGLAILEAEARKLGDGQVFSGEVAFTLYDTYGFPLDLTQDALRARNITVDTGAFGAAMERQRHKARAAWSGSGDAATETVWFAIRDKAGATEFLGYDTEAAEGVVLGLVKGGERVEAIGPGESGFAVLNQTPFYGESGGQVGDAGTISAPGLAVRVTDTQKKLGDLIVHAVSVLEGSLAVGAAVELTVDHRRRSAIRLNHSATHLLHEALRLTLGDHVAQKGSLVAPERLRFDFSHPKPIEPAELARIEDLANAVILENAPIETHLMAVDDAIASGARALFGEKYGEEVRVVSMGRGAPGANKAWSVELCGGTHAARTGDIGLVRIVSEGAVAAGVRRIEAMTGEGGRRYLVAESEMLGRLAAALKVPAHEAPARLEAIVEDRRRLERELAEARKRIAMGGGAAAGPEIVTAGKTRLLARAVSGVDLKDLKALADEGKKQVGSGVVAIVATAEDGRAGIVVGVTDDLTGSLNAVDLVRKGSEALGGKGGGGRPDMAQAGGPDGSKAAAALEAIAAALAAA